MKKLVALAVLAAPALLMAQEAAQPVAVPPAEGEAQPQAATVQDHAERKKMLYSLGCATACLIKNPKRNWRRINPKS